MAEHTKIEWTDATWNPITGCSIVDAGCTNCYAMHLAGTRLKHHPSRSGLTRESGGRPKWTGAVRLNDKWLDQPLRWSKPRMIFVCAHGDLFHESVPDGWIDRVFAVMAIARQHTFQVLTKRPDRAARYLTGILEGDYGSENVVEAASLITAGSDRAIEAAENAVWPLPNVWIGTSASDQDSANLRIPHLLDTPAAVRFVSLEPLLGPVDLADLERPAGAGAHCYSALDCDVDPCDDEWGGSTLDWVIVGGESGRNARVWDGLADAARILRDQCRSASVPFFMKQMAGPRKASMPPIPDDLMIREFPHG